MDEKQHCLDHSGLATCQQALLDKINEREKLVNMKFDLLDRALMISKSEMERRLEGMNEFRAQLDRQTKAFMTKTDLDYSVSKLEARAGVVEHAIRDIKQEIDRQMGARRWSDYLIMVGLSLIVALVTKYFT